MDTPNIISYEAMHRWLPRTTCFSTPVQTHGIDPRRFDHDISTLENLGTGGSKVLADNS